MKRTLEFINSLENEYKVELVSVNREIQRTELQIGKITEQIEDVRNSIDHSYEVFSSSQTANENIKTEITSLEELLDIYKQTLENLNIRRENIKAKLQEITDILQEQKSEMLDNESPETDIEMILAKLDFISKLIKIDAHRAIAEINYLKKNIDSRED
ncbi:MAG: hypothetical protein ACI4EW_10875 [Butyrivibrio sp.]